MLDVHEDAELAPRDVVARAIFEQTQAGTAHARHHQSHRCRDQTFSRQRPKPACATALTRALTPSRLRPLRTTTWAASRPTPMAKPAWTGFGSAGKRHQQACTAQTALPQTGC